MKSKSSVTLLSYTTHLAEQLSRYNRERTAETYTAATKSLIAFLGGSDIPLSQIGCATITSYEAHLRLKGLTTNTTSFYIRNLRAIYNHAVDDGIINDAQPFRRAYTGTCKTQKRAIDAASIRKIANFQSDNIALQRAADLFMFSFYARGMAFTDIATLKWQNISNGYLRYKRHKTGQTIVIEWNEHLQRIAQKYQQGSSGYIFPIIKGANPRREYLSASHAINLNLKKIAQRLGIATTLTFYVARHSWASIAYTIQIPVPTISRALGHNSESTTRIYLASLDNSAVDNANRLVLESISF